MISALDSTITFTHWHEHHIKERNHMFYDVVFQATLFNLYWKCFDDVCLLYIGEKL